MISSFFCSIDSHNKPLFYNGRMLNFDFLTFTSESDLNRHRALALPLSYPST